MAEESENIQENDLIKTRYVIFDVNKEILGIPLGSVQEVLDIDRIRKIPRISTMFAGVFNLRGEALPIINFAKCLFPQRTQESSEKQIGSYKVIVVRLQKEIIGIIVDNIRDIIELTDEAFDNIPNAIETKIPVDCIEKVAFIYEMLIKVLDIEKVFSESLSNLAESEKENNIISEKVVKPIEVSKPIKKTEISKKEEIKLLSQDQLDALREISNIASGKASTAMAKLFKQESQISISVDQAVLRKLNDIHKDISIDLNAQVVSLRAFIKKDMNASIFMILPIDSIKSLLEELEESVTIPESISSIDDLDNDIKSALIEFGNIIISHYCTGISDFLKIQVLHEVPVLVVDFYGSVIDGDIAKLAQFTEQVIFLQTQIRSNDKVITGQLIFIPSYESINNFVKWMDVDKIVKLLDAEANGSNPVELQSAQLEEKPTKKSSAKKTKKESAKPKAKEQVPDERIESEAEPTEDTFAKVQFQDEFQIPAADKKDLQIEDADLDVFRELGNIGAGNAGNALSQLLNKKVLLEIPPAKVMPLSELIKNYSVKNQMFIGYFGATQGLFETNILLLFTTDHIEQMLQIVMESDTSKSLKTESDLNPTEKSAVEEMLNILMGHYISAMSNFLKVSIDPPQYQFFFKKPKQLFNSLKIGADDKDIKAVVIETTLNVTEGHSIKGQFILLLHPDIFRKILDRIQEIW
jgi:chemotaxis protein CheC